MSNGDPTLLPKLIQHLLGWLAGRDNREFVLGDLEEAYVARNPQNSSQFWLWQEVAKAAPGLVLIRLRAISLQSVGLTLLLTVVAYFLLLLWGSYVTRPVMIGLRDHFPESQSVDYMFWYLPVRFSGIFLVGAAIAFFAFRRGVSFKQNFGRRLLPLLLVIILPQLLFLITSNENYSVGDGVVRTAFDGIALFLGAIFGAWLKGRLLQK